MLMHYLAAPLGAARDLVRLHGRSRYGPALLALTVALLLGVYQVRLGHTVHVGTLTDDRPYVAGMYPPEERPAGGRFRWTGGRGEIWLPGLGRGAYRLTLHLLGSDNVPPEVNVALNGQSLAQFTPAATPGEYMFDLPAALVGEGDLRIALMSPTFRPPGDQRDLGITLDRVTVTPTGDAGLLLPPRDQVLRLLAIVLLAYLVAAIAGFGPRGAALLGGSVATGLAAILLLNRPWLTVWTATLVWVALGAAALALALRLTLSPLYRCAGLPLGRLE